MTELFLSVLDMSLGGAILALLVLGARAVIKRRSGPFLPVLYALLVLRLALPFSVASPLSLQNLWNMSSLQPSAVAVQQGPKAGEEIIDTSQAVTDTPSVPQNAQPASPFSPNIILSENNTAAVPAPSPSPKILSLTDIAAVVWFGGAALVVIVVLAGNIRFLRLLKRNRAYDEPGFTALLASCREQLGLRRSVLVLQANGISAAAVYGVLRPRLLISPESFAPLTPDQKRHVLLHELSHIRRHDTAACLIAVLLCAVHWFNPLVWLSFALMRRDLEVFCDDRVILALGANERHSYASTLLALAAPSKTPRLASALFISHSHVKKRILTIVRRKKASALYSAIALLLTVIIAVTGCTTANTNIPPENTQQPVETGAPLEPSSTAEPRYLLSSASYGISEEEMGDAACVSNINKAVSLLNGLAIPKGETVSVMDSLGDLAAIDGWQEAMTSGWRRVSDMIFSEERTTVPSVSDERAVQTGGGLELVATALCIAARTAGLQVGLNLESGETLDEGSLTVYNPLDADVTIEMTKPYNMIIVSIYSSADLKLPASNSVNNAICSIGLSDSITGEALANLKKAAELLNGLHIAYKEQISVMDVLGDITEENGWKEASSNGWDYVSRMLQGLPAGVDEDVLQPGGGIEDLLFILLKAGESAKLDQSIVVPDDPNDLTAGDALVTNNVYLEGVTYHVSVENGTLSTQIVLPEAEEISAAPASLTASFSLDLSNHSDKARLSNIQKAAGLLDGVTIQPGNVLSLNELLGPRDENSGWLAASGIVGGAYVSEFGGGVSMFATALYNAAIRAGLEIVERVSHSIPVGYVDGGLDATISTGGPDLKIKNPYDTAIAFGAHVDDYTLIIDFYGPQPEYKIDFYSERTGETGMPETVYHYNAATTPDGYLIAPGQSAEWVKSRPGIEYTVYKTLTDSFGRVVSTELFSKEQYRAFKGQIYVNGPDPAI